MKLTVNRQALKVAMIYIIVAGVWTVGSDALLKRYSLNLEQGLDIDAIKDWSFMILMGILLYFLMGRLLRQSEREMEQQIGRAHV